MKPPTCKSIAGLDSLDSLQRDVSGQDSETNSETLRDRTGKNAGAAKKNGIPFQKTPKKLLKIGRG